MDVHTSSFHDSPSGLSSHRTSRCSDPARPAARAAGHLPLVPEGVVPSLRHPGSSSQDLAVGKQPLPKGATDPAVLEAPKMELARDGLGEPARLPLAWDAFPKCAPAAVPGEAARSAGVSDTGAETSGVIVWLIFHEDRSPEISAGVQARGWNKLIFHPGLVTGAHLQCNLFSISSNDFIS